MKTTKTYSLSWQNKLISTALAAAMLTLGAPQSAFATLPVVSSTNWIVSAGSATATATGVNSTGLPESITIAATSANTVLSWGAFSDGSPNGGLLASNDTISFNLPANGAILNNISGGPSFLGGRINSNGNVFFLNPAGVIVSSSAVINVNGFYASTVTDPSAASYFYANGTLGVFNNVAQTASAASGIIYVQSGSSITAAAGSGQIQLASNYSGAGVTITGNTNAVQSIPTTANSSAVTITINTSNAYDSGSSSLRGITVDSLTSSGSLVLNSLGSTSAVNANGITMSQGYPTAGGSLQGGNVTIYSNAGNVSTNGIIAGGNLVVSTPGTASGGSITMLGNVTVGGNATFTTNGQNISNNTNASAYLLTVTGGTTATANTGLSAGNVTIYGDLIGGSPSINGANVIVSDSNLVGTTRTLSQIIATGTVTANASYGLTISNVVAGGNLTVNAGANTGSGSASVGSSSAVSSLNGAVNFVQGAAGSTITNANFNGSSTASATVLAATTNYALTGMLANNVSLTNVTVNGSVIANASGKGTATLTGVTLSSLVNTGTISAVTNNGAITLTGVTVNKGSITATAGDTGSVIANSILLQNVTNNTQSSGQTDSYTTANGSITFTNYQTVTSAVTALTGSGVSNGTPLGDIKTSGANSTFGGPLSLTTNNGAVTMTNISILGATAGAISSNSVTVTVNSANTNVTISSLTDLKVPAVYELVGYITTNAPALFSGNTLISSNAAPLNTISITSTGNLTTGNMLAEQVTLNAGGTLSTLNVDVTANNASLLNITAGGDLSAQNFGTIGGANKSLTLKSNTGNVNIVSPGSHLFDSGTQSVTLTATTGNVNIASLVTSNGLTITAGNAITENGSGLINNVSTASSASATLTAPTITLIGAANTIPNLALINGSNGITINTAGVTTNIATKTNVTGNLTLSSSGSIGIGVAAADTVYVGGTTTLNTLNSIGNSSPITTASTGANLYGGVNITTNGSTVALGVLNGNNNFGSISISTTNTASGIAKNVNIDENGVTNLGTITAASLTVNANGIINNSGTVTATSAVLNSSSSTTTTTSTSSGTVTTTTIVPNSITLGTLNPTLITGITLTNANALTVNSAAATLTVTSTNQNLSVLNLTSNDLLYTSNMIFNGTGGSVGTVTAYTNNGKLTYSTSNDNTTTGSLTTNTGGIVARSDGSGSLGTVSFALGNSTQPTTITSNAGMIINNLTSLAGSTGTVLVTANTTSAGNIVLGSGISLLGAGAVTFCSGNSQLTSTTTFAGGISDAGTTGVTVNSAAPTTFIGKVISVTSPLNSIGAVSFTSNGSVAYTATGNINLAGLTLGASASGTNTIQSTTGNITQSGSITSSSTNSPISFLASSTGNNGVVLNGTVTINAAPANVISITASGNSTLNNANDITLGNVTVFPGSGQTTNSTDVQLQIISVSGNISQKSGTSVYVWGNTTLNTGGKNGVVLTQAGNNFGALTIGSGTSGNATITESATSSYTYVKANNFTAVSTYGDIVTPTINAQVLVSGNSNFKANNISLTNGSNQLSGGNGLSITLNAAANATIVDTNSQTIIANGSYVGGNLSVTNLNASGLITDQAGTSGITVNGIASLIANSSSGGINFTGTNDSFSGLLTRANSVTLFTKGNLVLAPGSVDTYAFITATGNISTSGLGGSGYGLLSLISGGNVSITNDTVFTSSLSITAPGTINLSALSTYVDLAKGTIVPVINGTATNTATSTYTPPNP